jgi:hypothetical protein
MMVPQARGEQQDGCNQKTAAALPVSVKRTTAAAAPTAAAAWQTQVCLGASAQPLMQSQFPHEYRYATAAVVTDSVRAWTTAVG